jgi:hypothetical protein
MLSERFLKRFYRGGKYRSTLTSSPNGWFKRVCFRWVYFVFIFILNLTGSAVQDASALTIVREFIGGAPQPIAVGSGNLVDIFNEAADHWERAILDPHVVTLRFGWAPVGGASHELLTQGGVPNRETAGLILFNNDSDVGHFQWFLDPTPHLDEEYLSYQETSMDLGGGIVNSGRIFSDAVGEADSGFTHIDLLSSALHEIGHSLGMSNANLAFISESADGDLDITSPHPFPGTTVPLAVNNFGVDSHPDPIAIPFGPVMGSQASDQRQLLTELDILMISQLGSFKEIRLDPYVETVPEPSTFFLLGSGLIGWFWWRARASG